MSKHPASVGLLGLGLLLAAATSPGLARADAPPSSRARAHTHHPVHAEQADTHHVDADAHCHSKPAACGLSLEAHAHAAAHHADAEAQCHSKPAACGLMKLRHHHS